MMKWWKTRIGSRWVLDAGVSVKGERTNRCEATNTFTHTKTPSRAVVTETAKHRAQSATETPTMSLAFVLSLPRSGSTVLTSLLDQRKGVISPPESSFPQMLGLATDKERSDPRRLAAIYLASTFPGTPLTLEEACTCMNGTDGEILTNIGKALAAKLGRNPEDVSLVVWKTTRTICLNRGPLATGGRFVILRRHPHNVFESQFRVHFGLHNRKPLRFAAFRESYEWAFSRIPRDRVFELDYEEIPTRLAALLEFLGIEDQGVWENGTSSLEQVAANRPWLSEILNEFRSDDAQKRSRLNPTQTGRLDCCIKSARLLRPAMPMLRRHYDQQTVEHIRRKAEDILGGVAPPGRQVKVV